MKIRDLTEAINFRMKHIANRMLMTPDGLKNLLKGLGHEIEDKPNAALTCVQVDAVAQNYIRGLQLFEKKIRARVHKGKFSKEAYARLFFMFLENQSPEGMLFDNFENWRLDVAKIEDFLCRLFLSPRVRKDKGSRFFRGVLRNMRISTKKPMLDIKSLLSSKIPPTMFFSYPGEDEDHAETSLRLGFSMTQMFFMLEAFVHQFNVYIRNLRDEKYNSINTENLRMQLVC